MTSTGTEIVVGDVQLKATPPQSNTAPTTANTTVDTRLTFPRDFPKAPPSGVAIIPFSAFEERGICDEPRADDPEELEVDRLGIPTIAMKSEHATDKCKTRTRRIKKAKEAKIKYLEKGLAVPWWVQWEDNESMRIAKPTNASDSRMSKFLNAAADFRSGRKWPALTNSQIDPTYLWTMMRVFMGIEGIAKKNDRPSRKKVFKTAEPTTFSEDEDDDSDSDIDMDEDDFSDGEDAMPADGRREKKAIHFMNDPEKMTRIFLSSYVRAKGIIWSKINLEQTPRLMQFWLQFLLRSRTLPRSDVGLRAAIEVCKQALLELPLTSELSSSLPDELSQGFHQCWGSKAEVFRPLGDSDPDWLIQLKENNENVAAANERAQIQAASEAKPAPESRQVEEKKEAEEDGGVADAGWGSTNNTEGQWNSSSNWGNAPDSGGWGQADGWNSESLEQAALEDQATNQWMTAPEALPSVMRFLGPTVLPLTHTTGIVEQSLRRITDLIPIPTNIPPKAAVSDEPYVADPAGVEADLERKFPKMVLSPWLNWDGGEEPAYSNPTILSTSQGLVVEPPYKVKTEDAESTATPKPHDPGNDPITVLVDPLVFEKLVKGVCLAATWVQIVRQPVEAGSAAPKKKKKGKKKGPANFWYLEAVAGVYPSYWTPKSS
ncbi:hypothetical protein D9611_002808 [Ephemerocybe angulata]|uniref:Uncharacterized protein n=1 Tax=Ephemerocybe angulata TaxID=980116 RepID=A0A8H5FDW3_9AGAR|nr:hypothetical protein D9611_002808 [Tulosesus angulatus]